MSVQSKKETLEQVKKEYKSKAVKYFVYLALAQIAFISGVVFAIMGGLIFGEESALAIIFYIPAGGLLMFWFIYNFIAAYKYMQLEGIESSSYTYKTGNKICTSEYDSSTNTVRTKVEDEYKTEGGGEYLVILMGIGLGGLIFYLVKRLQLRSQHRMNLYKLGFLTEETYIMKGNYVAEKCRTFFVFAVVNIISMIGLTLLILGIIWMNAINDNLYNAGNIFMPIGVFILIGSLIAAFIISGYAVDYNYSYFGMLVRIMFAGIIFCIIHIKKAKKEYEKKIAEFRKSQK